MRLTSLQYTQFRNKPQHWTLHGFAPGDMTLLVGANASGKSRTLSIIKNLASMVSGKIKMHFSSGEYVATFSDQNKTITYTLKYEDAEITEEVFERDGECLLRRGKDGIGTIHAEKDNKLMDFQSPPNELAVVARRDSIQHPFFDDLYQWGASLRYFPFGTPLGKTHLAVIVKDKDIPVDTDDPDNIVPIFHKGIKDFNQPFTDAIRSDMSSIGYPLDDITTEPPRSVTIPPSMQGPFVGLSVKEHDLLGFTDQFEMSQGMFRALSIVIQLNYSAMALSPSCILIDDIGEGLDYARSCSLINVLMRHAAKSKVQLIMATNDRFVMNSVPLQSWSLIKRVGNDSQVYNYENSKKAFEDFAVTGLSNFDFFATDFISGEPLE